MENESYLDSEDCLFHHDHLDSRQKLPFTSTRTKANNTPSCIIAPLYITLYLMLSSFRFDDVTFVRTSAGSAESAGKQNVMQSATCLVEAIILEWKDRDRIGSTIDPVICCIRELVHS
ncbi:hypothetical protein F2Q69_00049656 [Brassica cretica]|uniref:Uncharacterized protein n=1 Tax=Brassica cretica TaxID=69181 RepID=A0A8S9PTF9_BRACR|nr:hypothetical protein F2Q69_00049656 [Brassica cretica]